MLKIDYKFKDESLLRLAMTHSSYANEHHGTHLQCNERLEFLGDSVLGFVTAGYLFTHYPDLPEGDLTKLRAAVVCEGALDEIAHEIGIPEAIRLGHGEEMGGGRKRASILADATEALLGAIFMDGGIEPARAFVLRFIPHKVEVALAGGAFKDYKTMLQEIVQKNKQETLEYRLAGQSGPDHDKRFTMELLLNSNVFAQGIGKSKKEAEQMAAKKALEKIWDADAYRQTAIEINGKEVEKSISFEAVEKQRFPSSPRSKPRSRSNSEENAPCRHIFSFLLYKFRDTCSEFMNLLRKFYFMRAAARSKRVEMQLFRQTAKRSRNRPLFSA